nr:MAG TPA: hypothetical protein [Caudoviricetes sp.]
MKNKCIKTDSETPCSEQEEALAKFLTLGIDDILTSSELKEVFQRYLVRRIEDLVRSSDNLKKRLKLESILESIKLENIDRLPRYRFNFKPKGVAFDAVSGDTVNFTGPVTMIVLQRRVNTDMTAKSFGKESYLCVREYSPLHKLVVNSIYLEEPAVPVE